MAAAVEREQLLAAEAREQAAVLENEKERMEAQLRRELATANSEIAQLKQAAEQLQSDLADAESARAQDSKMATAKILI